MPIAQTPARFTNDAQWNILARMELVRPFERVNSGDARIAGGKGASLGEMTQAGVPVPPGFVVLTAAFERFLDETDLRQEVVAALASVDTDEMHTVERASERIAARIIEADMPQDIEEAIRAAFDMLGARFVAVRSSATAEDGSSAAWAGQLDTYLNTTADDLISNVRRCWASLYTPRAIFYRHEKGMQDEMISVAVVVQTMVQSDVSGIAFSVHPVTEDPNQLIIESGYGLGEAIVSGQVTPDSFVVDKQQRRIIDTNIAQQSRALYRAESGGNEWRTLSQEKGSTPSLTDGQVLDLADIIVRIEAHYGFPCDIEWALEGGRFFITQSRPITTLSQKAGPRPLMYTKQYTRDTTLIIQQAWCTALDAHRDTLGMHAFDGEILTLHYLHGGVIEIWEHPTWTQALMDTMLAINAENEDTFKRNVAEHAAAEALLRPFWEKGYTDSVAELRQVLDIVFTKMYFFDWMYYPSLDARTPQRIKDVVIPLREKDAYFDQTDRFIRKSLVAIYPHLAGYEQAILRSEIAAPPPLDVLKRRCEQFVVVGEHESYEGDLAGFKTGHPGIEFKIEQPFQKGMLTGQTGNAGMGRGRVRILLRKAQVSDMQKGEVLVSCMTTPDFTPAMQKAVAIVTDEGGIMCHAAIVARELGIPCLIGTRFATQILHDGDMVEVDAGSGALHVIGHETQPSILTKQYERERPFIYMMLWHETDRDGCRMFTGQSITHALQIVPPEGQAATVWYLGTEIADIEREALAMINADPALRARMIAHTEAAWTKIEPYLRREKSCSTVPEFMAFYRDVCSFWYALTTPYFNLPNHEGLDAGFKRDILRIRDMTQEYSQQMAGLLEETFRHVMPEYARYSRVIAPEEIERLSHGRDEQLIRTLETRMREGAFIYQSRIYPMSRLQEVLDAEGLVFETHDADVSELSGAIAYRGIAQGPVRVIRGRKDLERLQAGDVLVSVLTEPDYVAAMQKAVAIVTDEGGIMSHAAIVARELQKPCVIGTRSATAVLKDGDMVEVDAERGIVRKI